MLLAHEELFVERDERLCVRGRLRGGMEGDWTCQHCGRQGCWVTKVKCYRCGKSKYDQPVQQQQAGGSANVPGWIRTQAQQQTEREWNQAARGAGVGLGSGGQPLGQKPPQPQQGQGKQKQKSQTQSRAASPAPEEDTHEVLLAQLSGLIPSTLLEQVRTSLPRPEKPLAERMMQVQNKLDEEKKAVNSWREAVKVREAALVEGRKMLADHVTKMTGLQSELNSLETEFIAQRKDKEEKERMEEEQQLAATQIDVERTPIPDEDVDMEGGKKRRARSPEPLTYEQMEASILHSMETLGTKPEDYLAMIQRCMSKKMQQVHGPEKGEEVGSEPVIKEDGEVEDQNL